MVELSRGDAKQQEPSKAGAKRSWTPPPFPSALRGSGGGAGEDAEGGDSPASGRDAASQAGAVLEARAARTQGPASAHDGDGGEGGGSGDARLRAELERVLDAVAGLDAADGAAGKTVVFGHALSRDGQGSWRVQRFGNVHAQESGKHGTGPWTPYTVILIDKGTSTLTLRADVPGVPKKEVHLTVREKELSLDASGPDRSYRMRIGLPRAVVPDEGTARIVDGVLHVALPLARVLPPEGIALSVE